MTWLFVVCARDSTFSIVLFDTCCPLYGCGYELIVTLIVGTYLSDVPVSGEDTHLISIPVALMIRIRDRDNGFASIGKCIGCCCQCYGAITTSLPNDSMSANTCA